MQLPPSTQGSQGLLYKRCVKLRKKAKGKRNKAFAQKNRDIQLCKVSARQVYILKGLLT
jgi:hypothetical protein